jgi:hypothetical protein
MATQEHAGVSLEGVPAPILRFSVFGAIIAANLLISFFGRREMALSASTSQVIAGLFAWSSCVVIIEARWWQSHLGLKDYSNLFALSVGALAQASWQSIDALITAPFNVTFTLWLLSVLPYYAFVVLTKRVLFTADELRRLRSARKSRSTPGFD